jgi:hypothetical protein
LEAVSVWPTTAVPPIDGSADDDGAVDELVLRTTALVRAEDATTDPTVLLAVTLMSNRDPTAEDGTTKVEPVAPEMAEHDAPLASQLLHW